MVAVKAITERRSWLDWILRTAQVSTHEHGIQPDVICINPGHNERLDRYNPPLVMADSGTKFGLKLVVVPSSVLAHPRASPAARWVSLVSGWLEVRSDAAAWGGISSCLPLRPELCFQWLRGPGNRDIGV